MLKDVCTCECTCVSVCVCVAVNSYGCYIWFVNDLTDCNTWVLFFESFFPFLQFHNSVCEEVCACLCVAVNRHVCYI